MPIERTGQGPDSCQVQERGNGVRPDIRGAPAIPIRMMNDSARSRIAFFPPCKTCRRRPFPTGSSEHPRTVSGDHGARLVNPPGSWEAGREPGAGPHQSTCGNNRVSHGPARLWRVFWHGTVYSCRVLMNPVEQRAYPPQPGMELSRKGGQGPSDHKRGWEWGPRGIPIP